MSIKTLVTSALLLGSSTAALASPYTRTTTVQVRHDLRPRRFGHPVTVRPIARPWWGYFNYEQPVYQPTVVQPVVEPPVYQPPVEQPVVQPVYQPPVVQSEWMSLMAPRAIGGEGRAFVSIDSQPGALHALRLDAASGDTFVNAISIEYTDGRRQNLAIGQELSPENPSYEVALDSTCGIEDVTIDGRSEYGGSIAMSAM